MAIVALVPMPAIEGQLYFCMHFGVTLNGWGLMIRVVLRYRSTRLRARPAVNVQRLADTRMKQIVTATQIPA